MSKRRCEEGDRTLLSRPPPEPPTPTPKRRSESIERNIGSVSKRRCNRRRQNAIKPPPTPLHPNPPTPTPIQPPPNPSIRVTGVEKIHINAHCQAEKQSIKRVVTYDWGQKQTNTKKNEENVVFCFVFIFLVYFCFVMVTLPVELFFGDYVFDVFLFFIIVFAEINFLCSTRVIRLKTYDVTFPVFFKFVLSQG